MRRVLVGLICLCVLPCIGQTSNLPNAPASTLAVPVDDARWRTVENLAPGELIELRDRTTGVHTDCVLAYASPSAVGCDTGGPYDPTRRVAYPKAGIDEVWVIRWVHGPSGRAMLIGGGIGAVLGGLVVARGSGSAGQVAAGVGLGGLIGAACSNLGDPFHTRMSRRRYRVYRAP